MTYRIGGDVFFGARLAAGMTSAALALMLAGCASATVDDAVPAGARGPVNTGTFPNLNIPPKQAAAQLTPQQKAAAMAELTAAHRQNTATSAVPSGQTDPALLRKLASSHAADALKEIEKRP